MSKFKKGELVFNISDNKCYKFIRELTEGIFVENSSGDLLWKKKDSLMNLKEKDHKNKLILSGNIT